MKASSLRRLTRIVPLPDSVMAQIARRIGISYPEQRVVVGARGGFARFEIQDAREFVQRYVYFRGLYDVRTTRTIRSRLQAGDVFVDVGANIGWFTLLAAARVGRRGREVAFEPSSAIRDQLTRNVVLNGADNVTVEGCALAERDGSATFFASPEPQQRARHDRARRPRRA